MNDTDREAPVVDPTFLSHLVGVRRVLSDFAAISDEGPGEVEALRDAVVTAVEDLEAAGEELGRANAELRAVRGRAEDERRRYYELFDLAPDAFFVTDAMGVIREANRAAGAMVGVNPAMLAGKPLAVYVEPEQPRRFDDLLRRARREHVVEARLAVRPRHGSDFPVSLRVSRDWRAVRQNPGDGTEAGAVGRLQWALRNDSEQVQLEDRLSFLAMHDPLTGLPNRSLLVDRIDRLLARAQRSGTDVGVFFVDLDGFKDINDSLGHAAGDELLVEVAHRLRGVARGTDTAARLGGDEFIVAWEARADDEELQSFAARLAGLFEEPFHLSGNPVTVSASVGASVAPRGSGDPEALLYEADMAMYEVKRSGRSGSRVYDDDLREQVGDRLTLLRDLRVAINRDELAIVAQPQVRLDTTKIVGAEVLIRWDHPTFGRLSPAAFIPLAERSGLIIDIGRWVLDQTLALMATMPSPTSFSVNLSARQFAHPGLVAEVTDGLDRYGIDASRLCLEITETTVMGDLGAAVRVMRPLVSSGVVFAIDDFGTGYSSLRYLAQLPISVLKIDRAFVTDMVPDERSRKIVEAIVGMADGLGVDLVAEGVETAEQARLLQEMGVVVVQGFRFARPMSPEDLGGLVAAGGVVTPTEVEPPSD